MTTLEPIHNFIVNPFTISISIEIDWLSLVQTTINEHHLTVYQRVVHAVVFNLFIVDHGPFSVRLLSSLIRSTLVLLQNWVDILNIFGKKLTSQTLHPLRITNHSCELWVRLIPVPARCHTSFIGVFIPHAVFVDEERVVFSVAENHKLFAPLFPVEIVPLKGDAILNKPASIAIADLHHLSPLGLVGTSMLLQNWSHILNNSGNYFNLFLSGIQKLR